MFIKQQWNDYSNYFDLKKGERHAVERLGQGEEDP